MKCILVLQVPTPDLRYGRVLTVSSDLNIIREFCAAVLSNEEERIEDAQSPEDQDFSRMRLDQLRARLVWAVEDAL